MERRYDAVLFDLDGTLTDPYEGITKSVAYALGQFGIEVRDRSTLKRFIGPPLVDSFRDFYGFSEEDARLAVTHYRTYYTRDGIFDNRVYPGVPELLQCLQQAGIRILLATSKPEVFARQILEHFGLLPYFDFISGALLPRGRDRKAEVVAHALADGGLPAGARPVMVGDRFHDVEGAAACGIPAIGVLYGFGTREELLGTGAVAVVQTPGELPGCIGL